MLVILSIILSGLFANSTQYTQDYYLIAGRCHHKKDVGSTVRIRATYNKKDDGTVESYDIKFNIVEAVNPADTKYWKISYIEAGSSSKDPNVEANFCWSYNREWSWSEHGCSTIKFYPNDDIKIQDRGGNSHLCDKFPTGLWEIPKNNIYLTNI